MRAADPCPKQAHVIHDLRDRGPRRSGVVTALLLVYADGWRKAFDTVAVGLFHLAKELSGVGAEALDVAALALGIECVEGLARLARARNTRENDEFAPRNLDIDVLEIVGTGPSNLYPSIFGCAVLQSLSHV